MDDYLYTYAYLLLIIRSEKKWALEKKKILENWILVQMSQWEKNDSNPLFHIL